MNRLFASLLVISLLFAPETGQAAAGSSGAELKALVEKIQAKLRAGQTTEKHLAEEIQEFDTLLARHQGEKTDEIAHILVMKIMLYLEVFQDEEKALELTRQLARDFPETGPGQKAGDFAAAIEKQLAARKIRESLVEGAQFPDFQETDIEGNPLSISSHKGKVVLVDFWATWCMPCIVELPHVLKAYEKHHKNGFEIVGISLDRERDRNKFQAFLKDRNMPWQQFFDGLHWENKLAAKYGVNSIPATYLLDREGKIIAKDLPGDQLDAAIAKALASK